MFIVVHGSLCTHAGVSLGYIPRSWIAGFGEYSPLLDIASLFFKMIVPVLTPTSIVAIAQCPYPYLLLSDSYMSVFMMGVNYWFQFALPWLIVRLSFFHVYLPFAFRELPVHIFAHFPAGLSSSYWVQEFLHLRHAFSFVWCLLMFRVYYCYHHHHHYFNVIRIMNLLIVCVFLVSCLRNLTLQSVRYPTVFSSGRSTFHI